MTQELALRFTADYLREGGDFDEMLKPDGLLREAYRPLVATLETMPSSELLRRQEELSRILFEQGVSYNVYDHQEIRHPWAVDILPLVFSSQEWHTLERGLIQRAELFELILKDLYGRRLLLERKIIPPRLILSHPHFLRQCNGLFAEQDRPLIFHSADLARLKDGRFVVFNDRANAPSGSGYALENRLAISRLFPSLYRQSQVHRLAAFFRTLRSTLASRCRSIGSEPVIVFLTPGPGNETYFEHSFLSAYLGYELVQGDDLVVLDMVCHMRSFDGLKRVDVIIRRVDDAFCDPLELRGDSLLGVPGLLQAVREGNVLVANPPGSGILEHPGLHAFLEGASRFLLGEELRLSGLQTHWLGDERSRSMVLERLAEYVILPGVPDPGRPAYFPGSMSAQERQDLADSIQSNPSFFCAQAALAVSTCPVFNNGDLRAGKYNLRTFSVAAGDSFAILPGGLARISTDFADPLISNQKGAISKDVWILRSEPEPAAVLVEPGQSVHIQKTDRVPSRVAENLFWLGRYLERSESSARILRVAGQLMLDASAQNSALWLVLVSDMLETYPRYSSAENMGAMQAEIIRLIGDESCIGSLAFNLESLLFAAGNSFDRLSEDSIRIVNRLQNSRNNRPAGLDMKSYLDETVLSLSALSNNFAESMSQNAGWSLLQIGRRLERAILFIRLMRRFAGSGLARLEGLLESLLEVQNIKNTYKRRYRNAINLETIIDLLVFDQSNPRSLGYQILTLEDLIQGLRTRLSAPVQAERFLRRISALYRLKTTTDEFASGFPDIQSLLPWMEEIHGDLRDASDAIAHEFFAHASPQTRLESFTIRSDD